MDTDLAPNRKNPPIKCSDFHNMLLLYCTVNQQTQRLRFPDGVLALPAVTSRSRQRQLPFFYCNLPPEGDQNALVLVLEDSHAIYLFIQFMAQV